MRSSMIVFAGFLESGKTTAINELLIKSQNENVIILQCEEGIEQIQDKSKTVIEVEDFQSLNYQLFEDLLEKYPNHDVWIEYNGTWPLSKIYQMQLPRGLIIEQVLYFMDFNTANVYLTNMPTLILEQIHYADKMIFTRTEGKWFSKDDRILEVVETLKPGMEIKTSLDHIVSQGSKDKKSKIPYIVAFLILVIYIVYMFKSNS